MFYIDLVTKITNQLQLKMYKFVLVGSLLLACLAISLGVGEDGSGLTEKAMSGVKTVANKSAYGVERLTDGITVKVERFTNPPAHQPAQSNVLVSAGRGVGRLLRNLTVEAGRYVGNVASGAVRLGKHSAGAVVETIRESAQRIANPRGRSSNVKKSDGDESGSSNEAAGEDSNAATVDNGTAEDELKKES